MPAVIKAGKNGPLLRKLATVDLADHLAEVDGLLVRANRQVDQLLAKAKAEAARIMTEAEQERPRIQSRAQREGYETGFREGQEAGLAAGREEALGRWSEQFAREQGQLIEDLRRAVQDIEVQKQDLLVTAENDLLDFALAVATKLTFAIGLMYREAATENLRRAIRLVGGQTSLLVRVHPADLETMKVFAPSVLGGVQAAEAVKIIADDSLSPGGCIVQNEKTSVDASLETQVAEVAAQLLGRGATQ